jgi:hypothetical protein
MRVWCVTKASNTVLSAFFTVVTEPNKLREAPTMRRGGGGLVLGSALP